MTPEVDPPRKPAQGQRADGCDIVMMHFGRSGSTVLARQLAQHSRIAWLEEVFTLVRAADPQNYDLPVEQMRRVVEQKAQRRRGKRSGLIVGHEIKLQNFLHNPSATLPAYLRWCRDKGSCRHILLRRRNILRRIFSVYKAVATKVYHTSNSAASQTAKMYKVNMNDLFDPDTGQRSDTLAGLLAKARAREEAVVDIYSRLGIPYLSLTFEDDIEDDPRQAYLRVTEFLGLKNEPAEITLRRTGGASLRDEVTNFDAVGATLTGTEFEWMLD